MPNPLKRFVSYWTEIGEDMKARGEQSIFIVGIVITFLCWLWSANGGELASKLGIVVGVVFLLYGLIVAPFRKYDALEEKLNEVQKKLIPNLKGACGREILSSRVLTHFNSGEKAYYLRLVLKTVGVSSVNNCGGWITEVKHKGVVIMGNEKLRMKFADGDDQPRESLKSVRPGIEAHLDILVTVENNTVRVPTVQWYRPNSLAMYGEFLQGMIRDVGIYELKVTVAGDEGAPLMCEFEFNWQGNWETADLKLVKSNAGS